MILKHFFIRYSFIANSVTFAGLFGLGDFIEQQRERYNIKHNKKCNLKMKPYNFRRTLDMVIIGGLLSPVVHYWYVALDKVIVGNIHSMVLKKVLADEIIMSPIFGIAFLGGMAKLDGHSFERCWNEIKLKFWPMYKMDLCVWPAAQAVNFYVVPGQYRVAYVSFVALLWNIFLSYISHKKEDEF